MPVWSATGGSGSGASSESGSIGRRLDCTGLHLCKRLLARRRLLGGASAAGRLRYRSVVRLAIEQRRVIDGVCRDFRILWLLRHIAPGWTERLLLLAFDLILGHSVPALQLEMLPDGIVEYAHRAEPYRGREDGSGTSARAGSSGLLPLR